MELQQHMARLVQARDDLWKSVEGLPADAVRRRTPGEWSILDVLEHLYRMDKLSVGRIGEMVASPPLTVAVESRSFEQVLNRSVKVKAPEALAAQGIFTSLRDAREQMDLARQDLLRAIANTPVDALETRGSEHPVFGMISLDQRLQLMPLHERRHIAQIEEIKQAVL